MGERVHCICTGGCEEGRGGGKISLAPQPTVQIASLVPRSLGTSLVLGKHRPFLWFHNIQHRLLASFAHTVKTIRLRNALANKVSVIPTSSKGIYPE